jgi:3-dehydroquinate dehydratase type I
MKNRRICAVITGKDTDTSRIAAAADLFEVRIDLIGKGWQETAATLLKPWLACNRRREEGGNWQDSEDMRIKELLKALKAGAAVVDIELSTPGLKEIVPVIKTKAECLISSHNFKETPQLDVLKDIALSQIEAGADICKIVTFANSFEDNLTVLKLISELPGKRIIAFAMGEKGLLSRILCPLAGSEFTYASIEKGAESAAGQITVQELHEIYRTVRI